MKFVRISGHTINLSQIVRVETFSDRIEIHFSGSGPNLSLYQDEASVLVEALEAEDILEQRRSANKSFHELVEGLDPEDPFTHDSNNPLAD